MSDNFSYYYYAVSIGKFCDPDYPFDINININNLQTVLH